jgi:Ca2+-binding EF-hand superfamily protein
VVGERKAAEKERVSSTLDGTNEKKTKPVHRALVLEQPSQSRPRPAAACGSTMALSEEEDISSLKLRAKAAFSLVELQTKETRGKCDEREIPMLCRTLGLNPTQEQLLAIVEELRGVGPDGAANATGYVAYQRFEDVMLDLLTARRGEFARDNEQTIARAFRAFDPHGHGFVEAEHMKKLLATQGDAFDETEVEAMMEAAVEPGSNGKIYYEDFAAILASDGR